MKKLTGKAWFEKLEDAFPGTLERVCRESGFRPGDNMDREVAKTLDTLAYLTGGPTLTPDIVGHARREYGIVKRAALPRVTPKPKAAPVPPEPDPQQALREISDIVAREGLDIAVRLVPEESDDLGARIAAALDERLPHLVSAVSDRILGAIRGGEVANG